MVFLRHCELYKFTYLLTYLLKLESEHGPRLRYSSRVAIALGRDEEMPFSVASIRTLKAYVITVINFVQVTISL